MHNIKAMLAIAVGYSACIGFAFSALRKHRLFARAARWASTEGVIRESHEYKADKNLTHFRITYEFMADKVVTGTTPRLSGEWFLSSKQQTGFVERYPVGSLCTVYYDPENPGLNCLDMADKSGIKVLWAISALGGILATALVLLIAN